MPSCDRFLCDSLPLCLQMSQFIVQCLNPYRKPDCKVGRITTTEDFKHLARKVRSLGWGQCY